MRRKDREITDINEIEKIIQDAKVCRMGLCNDGQPYVVPHSFGYHDKVFYLHGAKKGLKTDILKKNNLICIEIDHEYKTLPDVETPAKSTVKYSSVIAFGKAQLLESESEAVKGLDVIVRHYVKDHPQQFNYGAAVKGVQVIKVTVESMTGKSSIVSS